MVNEQSTISAHLASNIFSYLEMIALTLHTNIQHKPPRTKPYLVLVHSTNHWWEQNFSHEPTLVSWPTIYIWKVLPMLDLTFSRRWIWRVLSSGIQSRVVRWESTAVSEEYVASIIRVKEYAMRYCNVVWSDYRRGFELDLLTTVTHNS
jgi:hypothetical protein